MYKSIMVIGGSGTVGKIIVSRLAQDFGSQLIIAGRSEERAIEVATQLQSDVRWRILDISKPLDYSNVLEDVGLVVMCLDVPEIEFVKQCFLRGIHYVDISAEFRILSAISDLEDIAKQGNATAILSVGLVPGLSNLMAQHSLKFINPVKQFDTAVLLGLGEKHGVAATTWVMSHLNDAQGINNFDFHEPFNKKPVYRFAISDQYTLTQTLPIAKAATWLGFDSALMTHILIGLPRLPLIRQIIRSQFMQNFLLTLSRMWQFGSKDFVLTALAEGQDAIYQMWISGTKESEVTGLVAAEIVTQLIENNKSRPGIFHIEELFEFKDFLPMLQRHNVTFSDKLFNKVQ